MRTRSVRSVIHLAMLSVVLIAVGCKHQAATNTAPSSSAPPVTSTAPPAAQPTVTLQASPTIVERGQSATLRWSSTNATSLTLAPGMGMVAPEGSTTATPVESTTYTITATGPGGTATSTARVTVTPGAAATSSSNMSDATLEQMFLREVQDAYFDYDKADILPASRDALSKTSQFLRSYPQVRVVVEGHCDERGSTEYNIALGDRRAQAAKNFLASSGISADRMQTVSYGKERPFCTEHDENCWKQNRRAHFVLAK